MATGTVTSFADNGFGFIFPDVGGGEFWVRPRSGRWQPSLAEGDRVEFEIVYGGMGAEAVDIRLLAE